MDGMSYTCHLCSAEKNGRGHALKTCMQTGQQMRHNARTSEAELKTRPELDRNKVVILEGYGHAGEEKKQTAASYVKEVYHQEFDDAVERYNARQKRSDRKIDDYLTHLEKNVNGQQIAVDFIIQFGEKDDWDGKSYEERQKTVPAYAAQLEDLKRLFPELVILQAAVHLDEVSPHMHVVAIPVAEYDATKGKRQKGLDKRVSKKAVFTRDRLEHMQTEMRECASRETGFTFKDPSRGRNNSITAYQYKNDKELREMVKWIDGQNAEIETKEAWMYEAQKWQNVAFKMTEQGFVLYNELREQHGKSAIPYSDKAINDFYRKMMDLTGAYGIIADERLGSDDGDKGGGGLWFDEQVR